METKHGKTIMETGQYALSSAGDHGELLQKGRKAEYYHNWMDSDNQYIPGDGIDIYSSFPIFLSDYKG
jgi:hypothetical protein